MPTSNNAGLTRPRRPQVGWGNTHGPPDGAGDTRRVSPDRLRAVVSGGRLASLAERATKAAGERIVRPTARFRVGCSHRGGSSRLPLARWRLGIVAIVISCGRHGAGVWSAPFSQLDRSRYNQPAARASGLSVDVTHFLPIARRRYAVTRPGYLARARRTDRGDP